GGFGGKRHRQRVERVIDDAVGRRFVLLAKLRRRRILALRQAVDAIVEEQDVDIEVAPDRVNKVIAADRQGVPIAGDYPPRQLRIRYLDAGGDRRGPAMNAMKAIGIHVVREAAGAADARYEDHVLAFDAELGHHFLHLREDGVIAAAGTPADLLIGDKIFSR